MDAARCATLFCFPQVLEDQKINKARRKWQKQTEFLCTIKFRNSLPDPPLGPHFLEVPLDLEKYVKYKPTTLESDYKWKVRVYQLLLSLLLLLLLLLFVMVLVSVLVVDNPVDSPVVDGAGVGVGVVGV